jgi:hypothetical protein
VTHQHPFDFATYPRRLNRALRRREITHDEYVILVAGLYARANRSTWIATLTLDQLFEAIAWEGSADWLYRRLRDLKRRGWIDYASQPGKKRHSYAIKLRYDRSGDSEEGPSTQPLKKAEFHVAARPTAPSSGLDTPSTDDGEIPLPEPVSATPTAERVRAPRDVRETPNPCFEREVLGGGLNQREVLGEAGDVDDFIAVFEGLQREEQPEPTSELLESLRGAITASERTRETRLAELRAIGTSPPAGEEETLQELDELIEAGVLIEVDT